LGINEAFFLQNSVGKSIPVLLILMSSKNSVELIYELTDLREMHQESFWNDNATKILVVLLTLHNNVGDVVNNVLQ
jgi:hypothetical protein